MTFFTKNMPETALEVAPKRTAALPTLAVCVAMMPPIYVIYMLLHYYLAAPYLDQWDLVPLIEKMYQGALGWPDIWAQHNEHRLVFPKLIMLGLARLTHWDIRYELAVSLLLAVGLFAILARQVGRGKEWLVAVLSVMVFSMSQWQNWFLGWQLQEFLNVLAVVAGFCVLGNERREWGRFISAIALGVVATFSFGNGLAYWPIGLAMLLSKAGFDDPGRVERCDCPSSAKTTHWVFVGAWTAVSVLTMALYFHGYKTPPNHPSTRLVLERPIEYLQYVFAYLGSPIINYSVTGAAIAGVIGLVILGLALIVLYPPQSPRMRGEGLEGTPRFQGENRSGKGNLQTHLPNEGDSAEEAALGLPPACGGTEGGKVNGVAPYLAMAAYSVAAAVVTGVGRVGFGGEQALSSRYITIAQLMWVALAVLVYEVLSARRRRRTMVVLAVIFMGALTVNALYGTLKWTERYQFKLPAQAELVSGDNEDLLQRLYPDPKVVLERREILRKYELSVFGK